MCKPSTSCFTDKTISSLELCPVSSTIAQTPSSTLLDETSTYDNVVVNQTGDSEDGPDIALFLGLAIALACVICCFAVVLVYLLTHRDKKEDDDTIGEAPRNSTLATPTVGGTMMSAGSTGTENTEYGAIEMASAVFEVIVSLLC